VLDTWFAVENKNLKGAPEYFENKLGTPDLHKQRLEIYCVLQPSRDVTLTIKALSM
jgi:hypothetical protein